MREGFGRCEVSVSDTLVTGHASPLPRKGKRREREVKREYRGVEGKGHITSKPTRCSNMYAPPRHGTRQLVSRLRSRNET